MGNEQSKINYSANDRLELQTAANPLDMTDMLQ